MSPSRLVLTIASSLCLCLLVVGLVFGVGEEAPESQTEPAGTSSPEPTADPGSQHDPAGSELMFFAAADCTATANCWDGSSVTCTASGPTAECSATDSSCPSVQGSCWSSDEGTKLCPPCPDCDAPSCEIYEGRSCKPGTQSPECDAGAPNCAHCFCTTGGFFICP